MMTTTTIQILISSNSSDTIRFKNDAEKYNCNSYNNHGKSLIIVVTVMCMHGTFL